ncbi:hypothetical protein MKX01_022614 [Papaver californicum]|nr:hypothetical protein MKX01_022614 [Papaver californicum]
MSLKEQTPALEDCLKHLKGERDEQQLAGFFLTTKFCTGYDHDSIYGIYDVVGDRFLNRLLMSGMGRVAVGVKEVNNNNLDAYLQLSVTILAEICCVPDIAASKHIISKVPVILEILSKGIVSTIYDGYYEFWFLISTVFEEGFTILYNSWCKEDDVRWGNSFYSIHQCPHITFFPKQFSLLHNAFKFEQLHLLTAILSSNYAAPVHNCLRLIVGVVAVLQNRVASAEKLQALILAESIISIIGEIVPIPADRCLLLVLEASRVEVAVLLNEIAYMKHEEKQSVKEETIKKIIKLISSVCGDEEAHAESLLNENTLGKVFMQRKGDDLLASVRVVGSYFAETPFSCKEKIHNLLEYMLSITKEIEGCKMLASFGGHNSVMGISTMACDTIMNLLLRREDIRVQFDGSIQKTNDQSICSLIFDSTPEEALVKHPNAGRIILNKLSQLIVGSLETFWQDVSDDGKANAGLHQIISKGYGGWFIDFQKFRNSPADETVIMNL